MNFTQITKALNEVSKMTSGNEKIKWLREHDDEDLKNILSWFFDNSYPTGIAEKKYDRTSCPVYDYAGTLTFQNAIDYLKKNNTGRDADVQYLRRVEKYICSNDEEKECFKKLVCKNFPMGINIPTINKVYPGLVPTFEVALCNKFQDFPKVIDGNTEYEISIKIDGCRATGFKENGKVRLISRQGKVWAGLKEVEQAMMNLPYDNFTFDGELTIKDFMNYPSDQVYKATTKIISTKDENKTGIQFNVFDVIPNNEWDKDCKLTQKERRALLNKMFESNTSDSLYLVPALYVGTDPNMISHLMKTFVEPNNYEGLVIKLTNSVYEHKRTKSWLKVKQMETYDLIITDYFEGENNFKGMLGGFVCDVNLPDGKKVHAKVGSGYSKDERIEFWKNPKLYIGKAMEVQGFELTTNDTDPGIYSIRFPVFKGFIPEGKELNGDYKS